MHIVTLTHTTWFFEPDDRLTGVNNSGPSYIIVEIGVATFLYGGKVFSFTIGGGARINFSNSTSSCYECEEGSELESHFVLMQMLINIYDAEEDWSRLSLWNIFYKA